MEIVVIYVKGVSVYSPYFLRPIVNIKLPVNATFGPLIYLHNPHSEPIQIVEVYTSGDDFHLELPSGNREGPKNIWEIAPFETKAVIRVKFSGKVERNHTAYVRIKLNITEEVLIVPLEVEVGPRGGIFSPQGYVDFGIGGTMDEPKTIKLCLYNPFTKPVKIQSISIKSKAVKLEYRPSVVIPTGKSKGGCANVANLTVDWKKAFKNQDFTGKIVVKYRNGKSTAEIPYHVTVLDGGIVFDSQATKYFTNDKSKNSLRHIKIKNVFKSSIKILNLTLGEEVKKYFKIHNFKTLTLKSQEEAIVFSSDLKAGVKLENLQVNSHIRLVSNISTVTIPFMSYGGTLKLYLPFKSKDYSLDVGLISFNTKKEVNFLVLNDNPVNIQVRAIKTSIPLTSTTIVGCGRENPKTALFQHSFENLHACNTLKPNEYAILKLVVQTANNEGHVWGEIQIETDYENLSIPVQFKVAAGKLEIGPDRLVFDQCFPGKICSHPLKVYSTFNEPMIIKDIISLPPDPRLHGRHAGHILPHTTKIVGHLYLNPNIGCGNECYTGLHQDLYNQWLKTLMLPKSVVNFDLNLFNTFYNRFLNITSNGMKKWQNLTLRLDTSEVRSHMFKTRVKMSWPSLIHGTPDNKSVISFPLTQIGNITYRNITIKNPSSNSLIIQILLDKVYPNIELLYEGLPSASLPEYVPPSNADNFFYVKNGFELKKFSEKINVKVHSSTLPLFMKPGENFTLSIGFRGEKVGEFSSLLFFRNNLTVMEILRLKGRSTEPIFRFGNRRPGAAQPLLFEFTEKHVKECERDNRHFRYQNPNIAIKRSFTARNTGEIPIVIRSFYINDVLCEGYGFKVLNCMPFVLPANGTKKIDIEFTPDFTLAKVLRSLVLESSCNSNINYTLQATIPSYYISVCSSMIPRPAWEWYLGYVAAISLSLTLIFGVFIAILDAEKFKRQMYDIILASGPSVQPVLDLRLVGQQVREEVKNTKMESNNDIPKIEVKTTNKVEPKIKNEVEQIQVAVPAVPKGKKKLGKKIDYSEFIGAPKKDIESTKQKTNVVDKKVKEEEKKSSHNKENKKVISSKKTCKLQVEEETLSSTTESSCNTDDIHEARDSSHEARDSSHEARDSNHEARDSNHEARDSSQKNSKHNLKKVIKPDNVSSRTLLEENHKEQPPAQSRIEKRKSPKNTLKSKEHIDNSKNQTPVTRNEVRKRYGKDNREKNTPCKKAVERPSTKTSDHQSSHPTSVSPTTKVWTENRATFSDVVARNDAVTNSRLGNNANHSSIYVDTHNQTTTPLGPIGSKPVDFWSNGVNTSHHSLQEHHVEPVNSFFSDFPTHESQNAPSNFSNNIQTNTWRNPLENQQTNQFDLLGGSSANSSSSQDHIPTWSHSGFFNTNTYWNGSNGTSLLGGLPTINLPTPVTTASGAIPSVQNRQNDYTSNSSTLWQQWTPFNLQTRTPPGFQNINPNTVGQTENPVTTESYNPFSSNVWTNNNIWRYSEDS
ncbi:transmembrane protein 131 isoform X2 [Harmonia axyridis]|uniref:transmembrane protein 131 isoform X2 n=1 Tax=Harmonia axyridis TaxID=115357 RepID=UPI001E277753|nr:transmembrane protein 131 isoform X2 [Harmonia axyridis]